MFSRWIELKNNNLLLIGPRRAGKTTLLRNRFPEYSYITLDDLDHLQWAKSDPKGLIESLAANAIIDEVQRAPELTIAIKYRIDRKDFKVCMTGSSSLGLLDQSADTLAGRIHIQHLPTFCWGEELGHSTHQILNDKLDPIKLNQAQRKLTEALTYGGFPEVIAADNSSQKQGILKQYKNTYFTRDLAQLSNIENVEGLLAILHHLARSIGSHLEVSSFAQDSGLSHPTAKKYLNILTQSDLAFKLYGYQYGPAKRYIKAAKMYFADNGIMTALNARVSEGQLFENFVISEFEKRRKLGLIKTDNFFYYKSVGNNEIDLIYEEDGILHAIEIKASKKLRQKDFTNLKSFLKERSEKKVKGCVIYAGSEYYLHEDISCIPAASIYRGI
ncbi:MAG: ATP-binding protein [Deltaproteobacteria bacterium]|nr:ATP-binding protein [Deltaproteobacteria bacterium]